MVGSCSNKRNKIKYILMVSSFKSILRTMLKEEGVQLNMSVLHIVTYLWVSALSGASM